MTADASYNVREVLVTTRLRDEAMGTKEKFWCRDNEGVHWLFKFAREGTGEHWSEKIAAEVGAALGVPCADVELARCAEHAGSISRSFVTRGQTSLVHGNELLQEIDASYPIVQLRGVTKHTVDAVLRRLSTIDAPAASVAQLRSAADVFVGYLLLDALIVNSDRHHENWGVLQLPKGIRVLAPSYDHASSLGRELRDEDRLARLTTRDARRSVDHYVARARSGFYEKDTDAKTLHPAAAFFRAAELLPEAGKVWLARIEGLEEDVLERIVARVPVSVIREPERAFARRVLHTARRILLERQLPEMK